MTALAPSPLFPRLAASWSAFRLKFRFKYELPAIKQHTTSSGIRLDLSPLPPMMKNIILEDRYETQERQLVAQHLTAADRVLELGGAIGYISLHCQKVIGIRDYTSVEANPHTLRHAVRNHRLNGLTPHIIHAAASAEDGSLQLDVSQDFWANTTLTPTTKNQEPRTKNQETTINVPSLSLKSLLAQLPYQPTALICDIEGAEQQLDFSALPASTKKIIIELHPHLYGPEEELLIQHRLQHAGFHHHSTAAGTSYYTRA